jgi:hypothetical protein
MQRYEQYKLDNMPKEPIVFKYIILYDGAYYHIIGNRSIYDFFRERGDFAYRNFYRKIFNMARLSPIKLQDSKLGVAILINSKYNLHGRVHYSLSHNFKLHGPIVLYNIRNGTISI